MTDLFSGMTTMIQDKKRYKRFLQATQALPAPYAETLQALQRYIWNFAKSGAIMDALEALLHMFQESAAEGVPVRQVVGDDPVEFAENIMAQYPDDLWLVKYRDQLRRSVEEASAHERH